MSQPNKAAFQGGTGQVQQQRIPISQEKNPMAIQIATALRYNKNLKQRQGINSTTKEKQDFFRYKRFARALESDEYKKQQLKTPTLLPLISNDDPKSIQQIFILLIQNQLILPVNKLKTKDAKAKKIAVDKQTPALELSSKAIIKPDEYYVWNFTPPNPYLLIYSILGVVVVFMLILFPLWPLWMRKGVWYLSTGLLCLVGVFFGIAIVRLIIYLITLAFMPRQFWLFPNLFEDCGVIESFKPFYAWEEPKANKSKGKTKGKKESTTSNTEKNTSTTTSSKTGPTSIKKRVATIEDVCEK